VISHRSRFVRSWLFAPADVERRASKCLNSGAGAGILDLEDAVAIVNKASARQAALKCLQVPRGSFGYVRINPIGEGGEDDLMIIVSGGLDGILLPKSEDAQTLLKADTLLSQLEASRGLPIGTVDLVPIIESCLGLSNVLEIARAYAACQPSRIRCRGSDARSRYRVDLRRRRTEDRPFSDRSCVACQWVGCAG